MPSIPRRLTGFRRVILIANVALVLLVAVSVALVSYFQLHQQAEDQALTQAALHARMAAESLGRIPDEILASARILRDRPTLARFLQTGNRRDLEPFLEQFRAGGNLDYVLVVRAGEVFGQAGDPFDPFILERWREVEEPFSSWWLDPNSTQPELQAVALAPLPARDGLPQGFVLISRRVDQRVADQRLSGAPARFEVLTRPRLTSSPVGSLEREVLYAEAPRSRVEPERDAYGAAMPMAISDGRMVAAVTARLSQAEFRDSLDRLVRRWLTIIAGLILVALIIGLVTSWRLGRPVKSLTRAAARMTGDDFSTPVPVIADRELGLLGDTMEGLRKRVLTLTEELRQREAEARLLVNNIVDGVFAVDMDRRIRFMNPQAARLLGIDAEHAAGRFCGDVLRPEPVHGRLPCHFDCPIIKARSGADTRSIEALDCAAGRRSVVIRSSPPAASRQVQLIRDETRTETGRRLRDSVIANVSHEFKTPLAAQVAALELLEDVDPADRAQLDQHLDSLRRATLRLNQLIDNLLESVRIDGNEDRLETAEIEVRALIDEAAGLVRPLLGQRRQQLEIRVDPELGLVEVDARRIVQVLVNLLSNAIKYAPEDTVIGLAAERVADQLRLVIEDQGPGLEDAERQSIFERFYRSPGLSAGQAGMGLGLWVVRSIAERHGGWADVVESAGGGSAFRVFVPRRRKAS